MGHVRGVSVGQSGTLRALLLIILSCAAARAECTICVVCRMHAGEICPFLCTSLHTKAAAAAALLDAWGAAHAHSMVSACYAQHLHAQHV